MSTFLWGVVCTLAGFAFLFWAYCLTYMVTRAHFSAKLTYEHDFLRMQASFLASELFNKMKENRNGEK